MESPQADVCARIGRGPIPVVQELLLFRLIGSIAGWRSFAILFIDDADLLRDSSLGVCGWRDGSLARNGGDGTVTGFGDG
jgi:hypothetical protein